MKSFRKELWFDIPGRRAFINITPEVQRCIDESGVKEGIVLVNAMHITASVFITMMNPGSIMIMISGSKNLPLMNLFHSTDIMSVKIMPMPI